MDHNTSTTAAAIQAQRQASEHTAVSRNTSTTDRKAPQQKGGSSKRDEVVDMIKNKRRAKGLFRRLSITENEATIDILNEVIAEQKDEMAAAKAEHQKKLEAATEALLVLQSQGVNEREFTALLEEAKKNISG